MPEPLKYFETMEQTLELFHDEQELICRAIIAQETLFETKRTEREITETLALLSTLITILVEKGRLKIL